jgi:VRR-NUC domain
MGRSLTQRERLLRTITEKEWTTTVIEVAKLNRWLVHHSRTAIMQSGRWATPLAGNTGLPDLIMLKPPHQIVAELKTETGVLTDEQIRWLKAFAAVPGVRAFVWRPSDLDTVWRVLSA